MRSAKKPSNEEERLAVLQNFYILDTPADEAFNDIARLASYICEAPIALVSFVDRDRQWFKANIGLAVSETSRDIAFCAHAILNHPDDLFTVPDASTDERFSDNPLVTRDPKIRFYAGAPLVVKGGWALGTICVMDHHPKELSPAQVAALKVLRNQAIRQLELHKSNVELSLQSTHDWLTKLYNRSYMEESMKRELYRAKRSKGSMGVILADIDHFKQINDMFGHLAGDKVLSAIGKFLQRHIRLGDIACRYGGEEFALVLPEATLEAACSRAEKMRVGVKELQVSHEDRKVDSLTLSFGVAAYPSNGDSTSTLLQAADKALYSAKRDGRDRVAAA
jgi:diguanylate cyclase (GGDEF)-like protein